MIKDFKLFGKWLGIFLLSGFLFYLPKNVLAEEIILPQIFQYNLQTDTLQKGFTFSFLEKEMQLAVLPKVFSEPMTLSVTIEDANLFVKPENFSRLSQIYRVKIDSKNKNFKLPVVFSLREVSRGNKNIYSFTDANGWQKISGANISDNNAKFLLTQSEIIFTVFQDSSIMVNGSASWYKYKNCLCAASPDYPKGTMLKVKDLDSDKEVIVRVNDFGPERNIFPDRVIDLDSVAFKKLAKLSRGIIKRVEVLPYLEQK
ncbi:MAG: septal ring lytic transglycosylase RlpA family protein [Patescibacteria group bacterium]